MPHRYVSNLGPDQTRQLVAGLLAKIPQSRSKNAAAGTDNPAKCFLIANARSGEHGPGVPVNAVNDRDQSPASSAMACCV